MELICALIIEEEPTCHFILPHCEDSCYLHLSADYSHKLIEKVLLSVLIRFERLSFELRAIMVQGKLTFSVYKGCKSQCRL